MTELRNALDNTERQSSTKEQGATIPADLSFSQIMHDTGKATQLLCEPIAFLAGMGSARVCCCLIVINILNTTPARSMVSHEERAQINDDLYKKPIQNAGACGASLIRGSAYFIGNLFGVLRAGTQKCLGQIQPTDAVLGYSREQINTAPGICDGIPLGYEDDPVLTAAPMRR